MSKLINSNIDSCSHSTHEFNKISVFLLFRCILAMLMYERQRCEFRVALQKRARRLQERKVDTLQRDKELFQVIN